MGAMIVLAKRWQVQGCLEQKVAIHPEIASEGNADNHNM